MPLPPQARDGADGAALHTVTAIEITAYPGASPNPALLSSPGSQRARATASPISICFGTV